MPSTNPAHHLAHLTDAAATLSTPAEVVAWSSAVSAEIERLQAKGLRLREAALRSSNQRRIAKAGDFCTAVEPELNRAAVAVRAVNTMFFIDPPSTARH